jgi:hypothetical protein
MNQTDYGLAPFLIAALGAAGVRYASTYAHATYLNKRYNFQSFDAEEAAGQIALAVEGKPHSRLILGTKARLAPGGTVQAYVKAAYLSAWLSRYLKSPPMTAYANELLKKARTTRNSRSKGKIESILYAAGTKIKKIADSMGKGEDKWVIMVLYTLGVKVRGKQRAIKQDIQVTQDHSYQLDPQKEAEESVKNLVNAPGRLFRSSRHKYKMKKQKLKTQMILGATLAVGVPLLGWALLSQRGG